MIRPFIDMLKAIQKKGDPEVAHADADAVLLDALDALGHPELRVEYDKIEKWYA